MKADLNQQMVVPPHIIIDLERTVYFIELTVPREDRVEEANELKKAKYAEMAGEAVQRGWSTRLRPIEIGAWGFVARSATSLLSELGICR